MGHGVRDLQLFLSLNPLNKKLSPGHSRLTKLLSAGSRSGSGTFLSLLPRKFSVNLQLCQTECQTVPKPHIEDLEDQFPYILVAGMKNISPPSAVERLAGA